MPTVPHGRPVNRSRIVPDSLPEEIPESIVPPFARLSVTHELTQKQLRVTLTPGRVEVQAGREKRNMVDSAFDGVLCEVLVSAFPGIELPPHEGLLKLREKYGVLQDGFSNALREHGELVVKLAEAEAANTGLEEALSATRTEISTLNTENGKLDETLFNLRIELEEKTRELATASEELEKYRHAPKTDPVPASLEAISEEKL